MERVLVDGLVARVIPPRPRKERESVLDDAVMLSCPDTLMDLKIDCDEPVSVFVILLPSTEIPEPAERDKIPELEILRPSMVIPSPDVRFKSPDLELSERTPVLEMVGV